MTAASATLVRGGQGRDGAPDLRTGNIGSRRGLSLPFSKSTSAFCQSVRGTAAPRRVTPWSAATGMLRTRFFARLIAAPAPLPPCGRRAWIRCEMFRQAARPVLSCRQAQTVSEESTPRSGSMISVTRRSICWPAMIVSARVPLPATIRLTPSDRTAAIILLTSECSPFDVLADGSVLRGVDPSQIAAVNGRRRRGRGRAG
jgi:hypothetical protein